MKPSSTAAYRKAKRARQRLEFWGLPVPEGMKHGRSTLACEAYGCDCKACLPSGKRTKLGEGGKLTHDERQRRLRAAKLGLPVPPGARHGLYTYRVYGCRCDACRAARRHSEQQKANRWRETAVGSWSTRDSNDVIHWPPVGEGLWTCPECGQAFRRRRQTHARAA